ncbi:antibiotic biosynthesis monooxygenase family protein [Amycolatopsis sp. NPDC059657]|uniref:antibiotic biosynthesis monooxygenase family protein n=1 Tax=Amycolatopsis sp. NPDC059657 TaxID=3346899 RepID=UPI00366AE168
MTAPLRVVLYARAPEADSGAVERAYHEISRTLSGTPGLLSNELLRSVHEPDSLVVISEWQSKEAFDVWEQGTEHRQATAPLRPFQDPARGFGIYQVVSRYDESAASTEGKGDGD